MKSAFSGEPAYPVPLLHPDQFVFPCPEADLLCMCQALAPAGVGMYVLEGIMVVVPVRLFQMVRQLFGYISETKTSSVL